MGCNCGGKRTTATKFAYVTPEGQTRVYATEVEAKAAKIRAGGVGEVKPA
jgi:hypothetical protein